MEHIKKTIAVAYLRAQGDQHEASIERQLSACETQTTLLGLTLGNVYADQGGAATVAGREALAGLLRDAERGEFGVLVIEHPDRLSRNLDDLAALVTSLSRYGVEIMQVGWGRITLRDVCFQGMGEHERRRIAAKRTSFGLHPAARGRLVSGRYCYGYRLGPGNPGERVIVPEQAAVIREAFELRLGKLSPNRIADVLSARKDALRTWNGRGVERVLRTEMYSGMIVYGRTARVRDVDTGLIRIVPRPQREWVLYPVEHLTIVARATWEAVQAMFGIGPRVPAEPTPATDPESGPAIR
ncbi:recombinase family protein [Methylobacterium sp. E-041]|uniref:recombinase family protein n=1 Tax=Methylobacterium sp. E-041 TaxID=2836573 RepID=UPI001FBB77CA|nr:recombinase family protein [Methylobacterium sp. E-041]MCJ2109210.1 recombinase family protein [Methylobacterium sp. E-041]